jgi:manganese/zinc/iron transport system permease protein
MLDYTLQTIALGAGLLGATSGLLGSYAVLRRQSLLGDAVSHAALPGVALAFLITGGKTMPALLLGAAATGLLAALLINVITRYSRIKEDTALGLVLSVFFGAGLMLLTYIQHLPQAAHAGLETFLFGQAATLVRRDVAAIAMVGAVVVILITLFWKEFKVMAFDPEYGVSMGLPMARLETLMSVMLVAGTVIGLQAVGVVLMSAMLVAPASAARQWTERLWVMVTLSAAFGAAAGVAGAVASASAGKIPTGPAIVIALSSIVLFSIALAPRRGLLWRAAKSARDRRVLKLELILLDLLSLSRQHGGISREHGGMSQEPDGLHRRCGGLSQNPDDLRHAHGRDSQGSGGVCHGHSAEIFKALRGRTSDVMRDLRELGRRGWAIETCPGSWSITEAGMVAAGRIASTDTGDTGGTSSGGARDAGTAGGKSGVTASIAERGANAGTTGGGGGDTTGAGGTGGAGDLQ